MVSQRRLSGQIPEREHDHDLGAGVPPNTVFLVRLARPRAQLSARSPFHSTFTQPIVDQAYSVYYNPRHRHEPCSFFLCSPLRYHFFRASCGLWVSTTWLFGFRIMALAWALFFCTAPVVTISFFPLHLGLSFGLDGTCYTRHGCNHLLICRVPHSAATPFSLWFFLPTTDSILHYFNINY